MISKSHSLAVAPERNVCKVGLLGEQLVNWGGGCDLLRFIAAGLTSPEYHVSLLLPQRTIASRIRGELGAWKRMVANVVRMERPRYTKERAFAAAQVVANVESSGCAIEPRYYDRTRAGLASIMGVQGINVILPCLQSLGREFGHPWVGYIPDLQHKTLPHFFSGSERANRDRGFQQLLDDACCLVVTSRSVKGDLERHYDASRCHIVVLPFAPLPQPEWLTGDSQQVSAKYSLPARYFLISNQFWQHKDHATAFEALALLAARDVEMICTGNTHDYRAPEHFTSLKRLVHKLGIERRVRFLGHIAKSDQMAIMRGAVAVVQPTLFEGGPGGGSVYDAVGIGTPAIVSDIAVNCEIADEGVKYFRVGSAQHLAEKLGEALSAPLVRPGSESLLERATWRRKRLAAALTQAVELASESKMPVMA